MKIQPLLDAKRLVFVDESGFRLGSPQRYGWAPIGQKAPGKSTQGRWETMTMIGAVALDGLRGFLTIDAATNTEVFVAFVRHELCPRLNPGDLVVMDNLSAHKVSEVRILIQERGADVLFIPPYSPEFNPIEQVWAKLKGIIRRFATRTRDAFDRAVAYALDAITSQDIRAWTDYAGYSVQA